MARKSYQRMVELLRRPRYITYPCKLRSSDQANAVVHSAQTLAERSLQLASIVNRHSTVTHYQRPTVTQLQEGGTGGEVSEILFFSAKSKRPPSLIYSMQIIPVCLSIVTRRKGVSATRRGGLNWTPISLLMGHPCKLFHSQHWTALQASIGLNPPSVTCGLASDLSSTPEVGAGCVNAHVRICAGGLAQPSSLPR